LWADALLDTAAALPDSELTVQAESQAANSAASLYERAAAAYCAVVVAPGGVVRPDAAVNAANSLCAWAERALGASMGGGGGGGGGAEAEGALLQRAVDLYKAALQQEEDALVRGCPRRGMAAGMAARARGWGR
jgi:hypothetical protein